MSRPPILETFTGEEGDGKAALLYWWRTGPPTHWEEGRRVAVGQSDSRALYSCSQEGASTSTGTNSQPGHVERGPCGHQGRPHHISGGPA